jgi:hypothetical protein
MIWQLESRAADKAELAAIREQDQKQEEQGAKANRSLEGKPLTRSVWQTPEFLESE